MDQERILEALKRGFLPGFLSGTDNNPAAAKEKAARNFEKQLFHNGTYKFDGFKFDNLASEELRKLAQHHDFLRDWSSQDRQQAKEKDRRRMESDRAWLECFSGQIPKHWDHWGRVSDDFYKANELGIQLSEKLVDAGISHPHRLTAYDVAKYQKLNPKQLALFLIRTDYDSSVKLEIRDIQRNKRVSREDIDKAMAIAAQLETTINKDQNLGPQIVKAYSDLNSN